MERRVQRNVGHNPAFASLRSFRRQARVCNLRLHCGNRERRYADRRSSPQLRRIHRYSCAARRQLRVRFRDYGLRHRALGAAKRKREILGDYDLFYADCKLVYDDYKRLCRFERTFNRRQQSSG